VELGDLNGRTAWLAGRDDLVHGYTLWFQITENRMDFSGTNNAVRLEVAAPPVGVHALGDLDQ